jgi:hypothetical protein
MLRVSTLRLGILVPWHHAVRMDRYRTTRQRERSLPSLAGCFLHRCDRARVQMKYRPTAHPTLVKIITRIVQR